MATAEEPQTGIVAEEFITCEGCPHPITVGMLTEGQQLCDEELRELGDPADFDMASASRAAELRDTRNRAWLAACKARKECLACEGPARGLCGRRPRQTPGDQEEETMRLLGHVSASNWHSPIRPGE